MASRYADVYAGWKSDPQSFWSNAANAIDWFERPARAFDADAGIYGHWFAEGITNTCYNCLDRHVAAGRGEQIAFIYDSPVTGRVERISYASLLGDVAALAAVYRKLGVGNGDRIIIYMPMIPQAAVAMLAAARIGAVHSVVFGGFADILPTGCTLLAESAVSADDMSPDTLQKRIDAAKAEIEEGNHHHEHLTKLEKHLYELTNLHEVLVAA